MAKKLLQIFNSLSKWLAVFGKQVSWAKLKAEFKVTSEIPFSVNNLTKF